MQFPVCIYVYTFCYNNAAILPAVISYWEKYATHVVVYDNHSTDNSIEIFNKYNWIEVHTYDSDDRYDPKKIQQLKNSIYKDSPADYVMVCDIDEVLEWNDNLFDFLTTSKSSNISYFISNYCDVIKTSPITETSLVQYSKDAYLLKNFDYTKVLLFDPKANVQLINYSTNYSLDNYSLKVDHISVLHLKMVDAWNYISTQSSYVKRLAKPNQYVYQYGQDEKSCIDLINKKIKQYHTKTMSADLAYCSIDSIKYSLEKKGSSCVILIIADKEIINNDEQMSLKRIIKLFGSKYDIVLLHPNYINLKMYKDLYNFNTISCSGSCFVKNGYSKMMESSDIYEALSEYQYMFTLPLSSWVFTDKLDKFMMLEYDYIAAPIKVENNIESIGSLISFKNIQKCLYGILKCNSSEYENNEALFFSKSVKNALGAEFQVAPIQCAAEFALVDNEKSWLEKYGIKYPMCCDNWTGKEIWLDKIPYLPNEVEQETKKEMEKKEEMLKRLAEEKQQQEAEKQKLEELIRLENELKKAILEALVKAELAEQAKLEEEKRQILIKERYKKERRAARLEAIAKRKAEIQRQLIELQNRILALLKAIDNIIKKPNEPIKIELPGYPCKTITNAPEVYNICLIHYNTPKLVECLIKSIERFGHNVKIYIFDNSDKLPFTLRLDNIVYFDNTKGQIIDFDSILAKYPNRVNSGGKTNNYGSFKHCISVDKCFDLIGDNFILMDTDILLKRDYVEIWNENYLAAGMPFKQWNNEMRLAPFMCFINVKECLKKNIRYFDFKHMHGLGITTAGEGYDTGRWFYTLVIDNLMIIALDQYILHYGGGSWSEISNNRDIKPNQIGDRDKKMTPDEWLEKHKNLWRNLLWIDYICEGENGLPELNYDYTDKIIITMTSWKMRIKNVKTVLASILKNTMLPDKIVLNLAIEEFRNKELDLPNDLVTFIQLNPLIEINWVKHDTLVWKKIFPTLFKYPTANVICIDDDRNYPTNYIQTYYDASLKITDGPISGANIKMYNKLILHCGHTSLDKYEYYEKYIDFIDNKIMNLMSSDSVYTFLADKCGHPIKYLGTDFHHLIQEGLKVRNNNGYSASNHIDVTKVFPKLEELWTKYINNL